MFIISWIVMQVLLANSVVVPATIITVVTIAAVAEVVASVIVTAISVYALKR